MSELLTAAGLVVGSFASTNVDNLVLLVGWLTARGTETRQVFAGYLIGMSLLLGLAFGLGLVANLIPIESLGLLGLVPIVLGLKLLVDLGPIRGGDASTATHREWCPGRDRRDHSARQRRRHGSGLLARCSPTAIATSTR